MTDRIFALTVLLDDDIREDDVEVVINAIRMIRRVQKVEAHIANLEVWAGEERARKRLTEQLWNVLHLDEEGKRRVSVG